MDKKTHHPQVWLVQFGDSNLNFELVVWLKPEAVKRPGAVLADYLWEIESKLINMVLKFLFHSEICMCEVCLD
jgi:small-conductance mechanosensitive channel